jgi:hypothetical protein
MTTAAPPRTWSLPAFGTTDAQQAGTAATAARDLGAEVARLGQHQHARLAAAGHAWQGEGATAALDRLVALNLELDRLARLLDELAQVLARYASQLEAAHHKHHWSLKRIAEIGAVVVVTGAVVAVTLGAAAPEAAAADAALIEGEVAAATEATEEVLTAARGAEQAYGVLARAARGLQGFLNARKLTQVQTALYTGYDAIEQLRHDGRLSARRLAADVAIGAVVPEALDGLGGALRLVPRVGTALRAGEATIAGRAVAAGSQAAATGAASQYLTSGRVDPESVAYDGLSAAGFRASSDSVRSAVRSFMSEVKVLKGSPGLRPPPELRRPHVIDPDDSPEILYHPRYKHFYRTGVGKADTFITVDTARHGGSAFKHYQREGRLMKWDFDLDEFGDRIEDKHKSDASKILQLKDFRTVKR